MTRDELVKLLMNTGSYDSEIFVCNPDNTADYFVDKLYFNRDKDQIFIVTSE